MTPSWCSVVTEMVTVLPDRSVERSWNVVQVSRSPILMWIETSTGLVCRKSTLMSLIGAGAMTAFEAGVVVVAGRALVEAGIIVEVDGAAQPATIEENATRQKSMSEAVNPFITGILPSLRSDYW